MNTLDLDLQIASSSTSIPDHKTFQKWAMAALPEQTALELTIRVVDEAESQALNAQYRGKDKPTNVLSFPFEAPAEIELNLLGDLVICAPVVAQEAKEQNKSELAHWAHMVIHGVLHLRGYDHIEDEEADVMESLEIKLLQTLGFDNPYIDKA